MLSALTYKSGTVLKGEGRNPQQRGKIKGSLDGRNGTKEFKKHIALNLYVLTSEGDERCCYFQKNSQFVRFSDAHCPSKKKNLQWAKPENKLQDENEF